MTRAGSDVLMVSCPSCYTISMFQGWNHRFMRNRSIGLVLGMEVGDEMVWDVVVRKKSVYL